MADGKPTLGQAKRAVWDRMYYARTEDGKAEALGLLEALVTAAKEEERRDLLRRLQEEIVAPTPKESKKEPCKDCTAILEHFNKLTGMNCLLVGNAAKYMHGAHLKYGPQDCLAVVTFKQTEWASDPMMKRHVDLLTLFRPSNFDRYVNQAKRPETPLTMALPVGDFD